MTISLSSRLHLSSQSTDTPSALPTLASCGNNLEHYVKAMEQHFAGDGAKLYAHVAGLKQSAQSADLRAAFIDGSEALRDFLGIRNPNGISSPRISVSDAPAGLVMAATHSTQAKHVQQSLARLEEELKTNPPGRHASHEYQQSVETALGKLMQDLHKLPTEASQQKAVAIIAQHLSQLNSKARAHIESLAHKAMGSMPNMEESPQPQRADNRGRGIFASMLQNSATASLRGGTTNPVSIPHLNNSPLPKVTKVTIPAPILASILQDLSIDPPGSETTNPASRPYTPIKLENYPAYGGQIQARVQCTDYARQAAELLIDQNGELDGAHISMMLHQLKTDKTLPLEHRRHLMLTLAKLQQGGELAETINSICQDKPLKGGAADVVRGTLNLPPEHELTNKDARKAVVMSLLGYLRQDTAVGACFATAPAICLLGSSPEVVAKDMKELLEEQKRTFQQDGVLFETPLNQHVFHSHAPIIVAVREDGTFLQQQSNGNWSKHHLPDIPGMKAALNALGIPENEQQAAIVTALSQMGSASDQNMALDISGLKAVLNAYGIPENEQQARIDAMLSQMGVTSPRDAGHNVDCKKIIEHLAHHTKGTDDPDKRMAAALRAFNGRQDVGLLQAWEYTLATCAVTQNSTYMNDEAAFAAFSLGMQPSSRPDLQSPLEKSTAFVAQLAADPRFERTELVQINQHLFNEIGELCMRRFTHQFDLNVANPFISDGVTGYAGSTLYGKTPTDHPPQWRRIDNADAFQEAMAQLVKDASGMATAHVDHMNGDPETRQEALRLMTDHLVAHIQDKTFIEHAVLRLNPEAADEPFGDANRYTKTPWQLPTSSTPIPIAKNYGSEIGHSKNYWRVTDQIPVNSPPVPVQSTPRPKVDDAVDFVHFICEGLVCMAPKLQAKAQESPDGFKIPFGNGPHAFTLMPMAMKELWLDNSVTPEQWIDANLKKPTNKWLNEPRISPPLSEFMRRLAFDIGAAPEQMQTMHHEISEKIKKSGGSKLNFEEPPYTFGDLHEKLGEFCRSQENGDTLLAKIQTAMSKLAIPARIIGDTNWSSEAGRSLYMGIMHNPFADKVEVQAMHLDGTNRKPLGDFETWFGQNVQSIIYAPLTHRIKPQANNQ